MPFGFILGRCSSRCTIIKFIVLFPFGGMLQHTLGIHTLGIHRLLVFARNWDTLFPALRLKIAPNCTNHIQLFIKDLLLPQSRMTVLHICLACMHSYYMPLWQYYCRTHWSSLSKADDIDYCSFKYWSNAVLVVYLPMDRCIQWETNMTWVHSVNSMLIQCNSCHMQGDRTGGLAIACCVCTHLCLKHLVISSFGSLCLQRYD